MNKSIRTLTMLGLAASIVSPVVLKAEDMDETKAKLAAMEESIDGLNAQMKEMQSVHIEGFVDTRYDVERVQNYTVNAAGGVNTAPTAYNIQGLDGIYNRRSEIKLNGNLSPNLVYNLGFDFTELKLKDVGVEVREIPVLPFVDAPDYVWSMKIGQYRQPFGIIAQTSSSAIPFSERPIMNGGKFDAGSVVGKLATKMVSERAMGVQMRQKVKYAGILNYDLAFGVFNNMTDDQSAGENAIQAGAAPAAGTFVKQGDNFKAQLGDPAMSEGGRLGLELDFLQVMLNNMMNNKNKVATGVSFSHDNQNTAWMTGDPTQLITNDMVGFDGLLEFANKMITLQGEYVRNSVVVGDAGVNYLNQAGFGKTTSREGWYLYGSLDLLPFFGTPTAGDSLQLLAGMEEQYLFDSSIAGTNNLVINPVNTAFKINAYSPNHKVSRLSGGIKWSYLGGKNHTSLNYIVSAPDQMFGGDGRGKLDNGTGVYVPETMVVIQQQFAFDNGKAK